ncbi:hypothetical protein PTSG_12777 [Salpingoeca rosetta]|uniref:Prolyl 4-hydroxylase alpha subunit domain-containing protein n=1 Tax=Salpingoeca rosetta (strain ATCC 50818 / BSB-021) TaxID=946362 RepID=F2UKG4_SALR5|nr:uncharacterized protein PTSG_12777 [Salpingoeca rosetta]EGD77613.1 hypothetical protein PTSG_12777 [Salpingoeca rosetta]|eukprot:XP_004990501.1 hypothetical protein PTSG_12777 [Salpingoeca rosetta]
MMVNASSSSTTTKQKPQPLTRRRSSRKPKPHRLPHTAASLFYGTQPDQIVRCRRKLHRIHAEPNIFFVEDFLTRHEVEHLSSFVKGMRLQRSFTESELGSQVISQERTSTFMWLSKGEDEIIRRIERRAAEMTGLTQSCIEPFQIVSYKHGQQFKLHHDAGTLLMGNEQDDDLCVDDDCRDGDADGDGDGDGDDDDSTLEATQEVKTDEDDADEEGEEAVACDRDGDSVDGGRGRGQSNDGDGGSSGTRRLRSSSVWPSIAAHQARESPSAASHTNTSPSSTSLLSSPLRRAADGNRNHSSNHTNDDSTNHTNNDSTNHTNNDSTNHTNNDSTSNGLVPTGARVEVQPPRRLATFFVYLNSLPHGQGHTEFPWLEGTPSVQPRSGCAVLFPNVERGGHVDIRTVHRAMPVTGDHRKLGLNVWLTDVEFPVVGDGSTRRRRKGKGKQASTTKAKAKAKKSSQVDSSSSSTQGSDADGGGDGGGDGEGTQERKKAKKGEKRG